jgi:hypothetical protein
MKLRYPAVECDWCGEVGWETDNSGPPGWFEVFRTEYRDSLDFCGWACIAAWAMDYVQKLLEAGVIEFPPQRHVRKDERGSGAIYE